MSTPVMSQPDSAKNTVTPRTPAAPNRSGAAWLSSTRPTARPRSASRPGSRAGRAGAPGAGEAGTGDASPVPGRPGPGAVVGAAAGWSSLT